jgi:hypothetical protein
MKKIYIWLLFVFFIFDLKSQTPEGDPDTGSTIPVDGGIVTITLVAAAYGAKRHKQQKENQENK